MPNKKTCPVCGKPEAEKYSPFCSRRCADVDLSRWMGGVYRIPSEDPPDGDEWPPETDETD